MGCCPKDTENIGGFLSGFVSNVEDTINETVSTQDDTSLNCLTMECSNDINDDALTPNNCRPWGTDGDWVYCPDGSYICGLREQYEPDQSDADGPVDEIGLNAVRFYC